MGDHTRGLTARTRMALAVFCSTLLLSLSHGQEMLNGNQQSFATAVEQEADNQRDVEDYDEANANFQRFVRSMYRVEPQHSTYILRSLRSSPTPPQQAFRDQFKIRALRSAGTKAGLSPSDLTSAARSSHSNYILRSLRSDPEQNAALKGNSNTGTGYVLRMV